MHDTSTLLVDHVVATDAALLDVDVTMLGDGGFMVAGSTAIALNQETFHCYAFRLAEVVPPALADELCTILAADAPTAPTPSLLDKLSAPLPTGIYDVLSTPLTVTPFTHTGIRVTSPAGYVGTDVYGGDEYGLFVRSPGDTKQHGYGHSLPDMPPELAYRGTVNQSAVVLMPLAPAHDQARVEHYVRRMIRGGRPTVLAFGCYGSDRAVIAVVVDGHHKLAAAARTGRPIQLLAFLSTRLVRNYASLAPLVADATVLDRARSHLVPDVAGVPRRPGDRRRFEEDSSAPDEGHGLNASSGVRSGRDLIRADGEMGAFSRRRS